jgi:hypothetical protein
MNWRIADGYPISYANEFLIQIVRDEFVITLGQLTLPAMVNPTREEVEALPKTISPVVVARVAVTPGSLKRLIELLRRHLDGYESGRIQGLSGVSDLPGSGQEA